MVLSESSGCSQRAHGAPMWSEGSQLDLVVSHRAQGALMGLGELSRGSQGTRVRFGVQGTLRSFVRLPWGPGALRVAQWALIWPSGLSKGCGALRGLGVLSEGPGKLSKGSRGSQGIRSSLGLGWFSDQVCGALRGRVGLSGGSQGLGNLMGSSGAKRLSYDSGAQESS